MPSNDGKNQGWGEQSTNNQDPRRAEPRGPFEDDTEKAFTLPKPTPELSQDEIDADEKRADSAIDDLEIEVDEEELNAESESPGRKY